MSQMPIIKLEIDGMKHTIIHHFREHTKQVQDAVDKEIDNAIANVDLNKIISKALEEVITASVHNHFSYGEGRRVVKDAVTEFLNPNIGE